MSNSAELRVPCSECLKDHGFCVYCSRTFASPNKLHRHIATKHPDTIRRMHCDGA